MTYLVLIDASAGRQLRDLPPDLRRRVDVRILALAHDPRPVGVKRIRANLYRVRVGQHRIAYTIEDERIVVHVVAVGHRKDVYRLLRRMGYL